MNKKYIKYIEYIVNDIEDPYFKYMRETYGLKQGEMDLVLSKVFNQPVTTKGRSVYDTNGNTIYYENSDGNWIKYEYDPNGNTIYSENSNGFWVKKEYDDNGNIIYWESNYGVIEDNR